MKRWTISAISWTLLTLFLSLIPNAEMPKTFLQEIFGIDKLGHMGFYSIMMLLWSLVITQKYAIRKAVIISGLFSLSFGIFLEILQKQLSSDRNFDLLDIVANLTGIVISAILILKYENLFTIFANSNKYPKVGN